MTWDDLTDALLTLLIVLALCATGCTHCQTYYRYDGGASARPYYKLTVCDRPDGTKTTTLECDSATRLPTASCH